MLLKLDNGRGIRLDVNLRKPETALSYVITYRNQETVATVTFNKGIPDVDCRGTWRLLR